MRFFTKPFTMTRGVLFLFSFLLLFGRGEASVTCATGHYRTGFSYTQRWWTYNDGSTNQSPPYHNNYCGAGVGTIKTGTSIRVYNDAIVTDEAKKQTCSVACAADGKKFSYYLRGNNVWPNPKFNTYYQDYQCYCASTCTITYSSSANTAYLYEASAQCAPVTVFSCDAGFGFLHGGESSDNSCSACQTGFYQPDNNSTNVCTAWTTESCPAGQYYTAGSATSDATCTPCGDNEYSSGGNATSCTAHSVSSCPAGERFTAGTSTTDSSCSTCDAGTFQPDADSTATSCSACPSGEYSNAAGASSCTPWSTCDAGYYFSGASSTQDGVCTQCDAGTFQPNSDSSATSCTACPSGDHVLDPTSQEQAVYRMECVRNAMLVPQAVRHGHCVLLVSVSQQGHPLLIHRVAHAMLGRFSPTRTAPQPPVVPVWMGTPPLVPQAVRHGQMPIAMLDLSLLLVPVARQFQQRTRLALLVPAVNGSLWTQR